MCEALSSSPSTEREREKERKKNNLLVYETGRLQLVLHVLECNIPGGVRHQCFVFLRPSPTPPK
jgi:hypothetical protein